MWLKLQIGQENTEFLKNTGIKRNLVLEPWEEDPDGKTAPNQVCKGNLTEKAAAEMLCSRVCPQSASRGSATKAYRTSVAVGEGNQTAS